MANDMQQTNTTRTTARRTGRAITIAGAAAGALLLWVVTDPWAGIDLAVRQGDTTQRLGPPDRSTADVVFDVRSLETLCPSVI